jgi:hypothetical protein
MKTAEIGMNVYRRQPLPYDFFFQGRVPSLFLSHMFIFEQGIYLDG